MPPLGRFSRAPSPYPFLLFHGIRVAQLVSSVIVMSFLAFFVHYLVADAYYVPWTFLVLLAVSAGTNLSVLVTAFFYHFRTLQPRLSWMINSGLTGLWALGFALLTWNLSGTLSHTCNVENWDHETGVMVCRIYKAVETFTITGFAATAASLALDLYIMRKTRERGVYNQMGDEKRGRPRHHPHHSRHDTVDEFSMRDQAGEEAGFRAPSIEFPEYMHEAKRPYKPRREMSAERFGYQRPEEQTSYEGAAARMLDRQFDHE